MKITKRTVENYLGSIDGSVHADMINLHEQIQIHMPNVKPELWEGVLWGGTKQQIIGYGELSYTRSDKQVVKWFRVGLAQQKHYISVYIFATEDGEYVVKKYGHLLGKAKLGSSSVSFKQLSDINIDELLKLVDKAYIQLDR